MLKLEVDDRDMSSLMDAAKDLSDAINRMLNSAKGAARPDASDEAKAELVSAVAEVETACGSAIGTVQKRAALRKLRASAKNAYAADVQLIAASQGVRAFNPDESSQAHLLALCKVRPAACLSSGTLLLLNCV